MSSTKLSMASRPGSLVDTECQVIWQSKVITKDKVSDRKELYAITADGLLFKSTLWSPHSSLDIPINSWISFKRARVGVFNNNKNISTIHMTSVAVSESMPVNRINRIPVSEIFGGFAFESTKDLRSKVEPGKCLFSNIRGVLVGFGDSTSYTSCMECKKKVENQCLFCPNSRIGQSLLVMLYLSVEDNSGFESITCFQDSIESLLLCKWDSDKSQESISDVVQKLNDLMDKEIGMRVKVEKKPSVDSNFKEPVYFTAFSPLFIFKN